MRRFLIIAACCCAILCACSTQKIDNKEPSEASQIQDDSQVAPEPAYEANKLQEDDMNSDTAPRKRFRVRRPELASAVFCGEQRSEEFGRIGICH